MSDADDAADDEYDDYLRQIVIDVLQDVFLLLKKGKTQEAIKMIRGARCWEDFDYSVRKRFGGKKQNK